MKNKIALITGATSGIGRATARLLAKQGFDLVACGRRQERLDELAQELGATVRVHTLRFDVRDAEAVNQAIASLPADFASIDLLVNNAGNAHGRGPIDQGDLADWDAMIDINVKGLLYVSRAVLPGMAARRSGHVINIGSVAGQEVYAGGNVYCASKFAVDALTKGMRLDLNAHGIRVTSVSPGLVETEFSLVRFKGDAQAAAKVYEGFSPLTADDIADLVVFAATRPPHVAIADITVFPTAQASSTVVNRKLD